MFEFKLQIGCLLVALYIIAIYIIEEGIGTDFDPILAKLFLDAKPEILAFIEADS